MEFLENAYYGTGVGVAFYYIRESYLKPNNAITDDYQMILGFYKAIEALVMLATFWLIWPGFVIGDLVWNLKKRGRKCGDTSEVIGGSTRS
jgi:hypothetical protein